MAVFKYLKGHIPVVLLIFVLLVAQVFCDLAIPSYTSRIVDVGLQQGGVPDAVASELPASALDEVCALLSAQDAAVVQGAYGPKANDPQVVSLDSAYASGEKRSELDRILVAPEARLYDEADVGEDPAADPGREGDESIQAQRAAAYVLSQYRALGLDVTAIQVTYLLVTGAKMFGLALLGLAIAVGVGALASRTAAFIARDLRAQLFSNVLTFSRAEMQEFSPASLITRCTNDIQQIQMVLVMLMRMVAYAPIMGIGASIMVAVTAPGISWIVAVAVVAIICVVVLLMRFTLPKFRIMQQLVDRVNLVSREMLTGVPVVRAFCRERHEEERFDGANRELTDTSLFTSRAMSLMMPVIMLLMNATSVAILWRERHEEERFDGANRELTDTSLFTSRAMSLMMPVIMLLMNATSVAILWFGGFDVQAGSVQVGDLIAFINYAMQVCMSFMMIAMVSIMLPRAQVAAARVNEVIAAQSAVRDPDPADVAPAPQGGWRGEVRYEHVGLRFGDADTNVLEDVSFTVRPGSTTAIIGSTGAGKSTLVRLLPRFYDVSEGRVTVDGVDVRTMRQADLRSLVGYVPQRAVLFSGTVRSNIAYSDPTMPFERVENAAEVAQAAEFIAKMDGGYDAAIAQGGTNVSGGQRQRLSIARAVAAAPRIFIFDDSFSALDFATEAAVREGLRREVADATVIVVAQRVASIADAEQIVVLDEGRVVGVGTHRELMESCAEYREIATSQLSEAELGRIAQVAEPRPPRSAGAHVPPVRNGRADSQEGGDGR